MFIDLDNTTYQVIVKRKKIKHIYFRWENDVLIVTCNNNLRDNSIKKLILDNKQSILKLKKRTPIRSINENEVYFLGDKYEIVYKSTTNTLLNDNQIICKDENELNKFLIKSAKKIFTERLARIKEEFDALPDFTLKIRKMSTRWGVCNIKSMTVTLNLELIKKDVTLIDYVIIHELCHFKHMNHSKEFWQEVEKYYPYYKRARKMLKEGMYD